jgi:hypothetical protein
MCHKCTNPDQRSLSARLNLKLQGRLYAWLLVRGHLADVAGAPWLGMYVACQVNVAASSDHMFKQAEDTGNWAGTPMSFAGLGGRFQQCRAAQLLQIGMNCLGE